jgi:hypothetical protein
VTAPFQTHDDQGRGWARSTSSRHRSVTSRT